MESRPGVLDGGRARAVDGVGNDVVRVFVERGGEAPAPAAGRTFTPPTGGRAAWKDVAGKHATVAVFPSFDCPMSAGYAKPLADMAAAYAGKGVAFVGVCPADEDAATVGKRA